MAARHGEAHFVHDFVQAWVKWEPDRFDLKYNEAA